MLTQFYLSAIALFLTGIAFAIPGRAANSDIEPAQLVVWAKTDLANQGAPTLDLLDLERYFARQLLIHRFDYVYPSATAKLLTTPGDHTYLLELSVDALQTAIRARQDNNGNYRDAPVLNIELAVTVKHVHSGQIRGRYYMPDEYPLTPDEMSQIAPKRAALYNSADRLAAFFAEKVSAGELGEQIRLSQRPLPISERIEPWHVFVALLGLLSIIIISITIASNTPKARQEREEREVAEEQKKKAQQHHYREKVLDALLDKARDISLETNGHSPAWYRAAALAKREEILRGAGETRSEEAKRRNRIKAIEEEYERIAVHGAARYHLDSSEIVEMLRQADERPFRLLQEAVSLQEGGK